MAMPLTDEQRQAIRDEEFFRDQVRKELAGPKRTPSFFERISAFFETKSGFWLLTTVLAGVTATGFTSLQRYLDREEIARREAAERSRRDMETVLKLGPMLTSDKLTQVNMALVLLDGLASDQALDTGVAQQVRALVQNTLDTGLKQGASDEERAQAKAIIDYADRARVASIQRPEPAASASAAVATPPVLGSSLSKALDNAALPVRVYLQVASEADIPKAEAAKTALRQAGLIAPGIEVVPPKSVPTQNDLRYCEGKIDANALERVRAAVATAVSPQPLLKPLAPRLCTNVRYNHFEIWYARSGG
jgi:hypothetical protein